MILSSEDKNEFDLSRIKFLHTTLNDYYINDIFAYQNSSIEYQDILTRFSNLCLDRIKIKSLANKLLNFSFLLHISRKNQVINQIFFSLLPSFPLELQSILINLLSWSWDLYLSDYHEP